MARNGADQGCGQEELESIGRVMVRFSFLEFLLKMWIWGLLNTPPQKGVIATGKMRFNETLELWMHFTGTKKEFYHPTSGS